MIDAAENKLADPARVNELIEIFLDTAREGGASLLEVSLAAKAVHSAASESVKLAIGEYVESLADEAAEGDEQGSDDVEEEPDHETADDGDEEKSPEDAATADAGKPSGLQGGREDEEYDE